MKNGSGGWGRKRGMGRSCMATFIMAERCYVVSFNRCSKVTSSHSSLFPSPGACQSTCMRTSGGTITAESLPLPSTSRDTHTRTHTLTHTHTHTHAHARAHAHRHRLTHKHIPAHREKDAWTCTRTHARGCYISAVSRRSLCSASLL